MFKNIINLMFKKNKNKPKFTGYKKSAEENEKCN